MITKYDENIDADIVKAALSRITNQIYRLLPAREEDIDWIKPLETLIIELSGMSSLLPEQEKLFALLCKLEGLLKGGNEIDFLLFRRTIFECCSLTSKIKDNVN